MLTGLDMAPLSQVAVLRGYLGVGMTVGVSCGSPLGGILADTIGWRWYDSVCS